jgi:hypothetical protein
MIGTPDGSSAIDGITFSESQSRVLFDRLVVCSPQVFGISDGQIFGKKDKVMKQLLYY